MKLRICLLAIVVFGSPSVFAGEYEDYYEKYSTNNNKISTAEIILIGEVHNVPLDKIMEYKLLGDFARPNDILLVEGGTLFPNINNYRSLKNDKLSSLAREEGFAVGGWDNGIMVMFLTEMLRAQYELHEILISEEATLTEKAGALIQGLGRRIGISIVNGEREETMIENLNELSAEFPDRKIFLISGRSHLEGNWILRELHHIGRPYTILIPREDNKGRVESITALDYVKSLIE